VTFKKLLTLFFLVIVINFQSFADDKSTIEVGWVGSLTGPTAKYGAFQAAEIAEEEINARGGVLGKKFKLIFEDTHSSGREAVSSTLKLININKVKYILGGHSSPESIPIAPIVERNKVIMIAAMTSSPKLTDAGDYIFRVTAISLPVGELVAKHATQELKAKTIAIVYAETDYAEPVANHLKKEFTRLGGKVIRFDGYHTGETDFRPLLTRIKAKSPDAIYLGSQAQDSAELFLKQLKELNIKVQVYGNEITGNALFVSNRGKDLFEGLIFGEPFFDPNRKEAKDFIKKFKKKFSVKNLPLGILTAEAYDSVMILADAINRCGDNVEAVKKCLYQTKNFPGASGVINIDHNGDSIRNFSLKRITDGVPKLIK